MRLQGMLDTPAPLLHYVDDVGLDTTCSIDEFKCPVTLEVCVDGWMGVCVDGWVCCLPTTSNTQSCR